MGGRGVVVREWGGRGGGAVGGLVTRGWRQAAGEGVGKAGWVIRWGTGGMGTVRKWPGLGKRVFYVD